jgi:hypothetical protein
MRNSRSPKRTVVFLFLNPIRKEGTAKLRFERGFKYAFNCELLKCWENRPPVLANVHNYSKTIKALLLC